MLLVLASSEEDPLRAGSSLAIMPAVPVVVVPVVAGSLDLESTSLFCLDRERDLVVAIAAAPVGLATNNTLVRVY